MYIYVYIRAGKTATVLAALGMLRGDLKKGLVRDFTFVEINCLRITSPHDAYTVLWRGISGEYMAHKSALNKLKNYFSDDTDTDGTGAGAGAGHNNKKRLSSEAGGGAGDGSSDENPFVICLLDELDYLVTANESVVYNFLQWPQLSNSGLIVVGIANTMDLPERLSKRSLSRLGGQSLSRIAFKAYTHEQIFTILSHRLRDLQGLFDKRSLELTARKAASAAGDLRSALKICQRYALCMYACMRVCMYVCMQYVCMHYCMSESPRSQRTAVDVHPFLNYFYSYVMFIYLFIYLFIYIIQGDRTPSRKSDAHIQ
jgi:origin recognition complex subunit 1